MRLLTKKIGILGYGKEGKSLEKFLQSRNVRDLQVYDEGDNDLPDFTQIGDRAVLLRSPGVPITHPALETFSGQITGTLELFLQLCQTKKVIGITGTKGKGTTATLLKNMFDEDNDIAYLLGNIGTPFFDEVAGIRSRDFVVAELSSFQLWDTEISPQIAIVLGITPDHLEVHEDFDDYLMAKQNIFAHQRSGGRVLYFVDDPITKQLVEEHVEADRRYPFSLTTEQERGGFIANDEFVWINDVGEREVICNIKEWKARGKFNLINALAAISAAKLVNMRTEPVVTALQKWRGLAGRLQLIAKHPTTAVSFWNDTMATVPTATVGAVESFTEDESLILVAGGKDKGVDFTEMAGLADRPGLKKILLIGDTAPKLLKIFGKKKAEIVTDFVGVLAYLQKNVADGDHVLLSPACSSFDQFDNVYDRGDQWKELAMTVLRG